MPCAHILKSKRYFNVKSSTYYFHIKKKIMVDFHICIAAHNLAKLFLLKACNSIYKFDIVFLSETYLDSSILHDDSNLKIPGIWFVLIIGQIKNVEVFMYYKSYLLLRIIDISYLNECVRFELMLGDKLCNFTALGI